jgi:putative transcription antitermination factor YqgF
MSILALDLGAKRVGMALNPTGTVVIELPTLVWQSITGLAAEIAAIVAEHKISTIVIGQPRPGTAEEKLVATLAEALGEVRLDLIDETLSTKEAERQLAAEGLTRGDSDARAARLILEQYLQERSEE